MQALEDSEREAIREAVENSALQRAQLIRHLSIANTLHGLMDDFA